MAFASWLLALIITTLAIAIFAPGHQRNPCTSNTRRTKPHTHPTMKTRSYCLKDIYRTYLKLNYIKLWELVWPPADGHAINEALCEELRLDPAVISLMKRLTYISDFSTTKDIGFYTYSRAMVYLEHDEIRGGRDPTFFEFQEPRLFHILPHELTLICDGDEGSNIILDIKENTIRVEDFHDFPPGRDAPP
ncbi:hypothetical protein BJX65DRAFT_315095 [Aspergillus insuetus]